MCCFLFFCLHLLRVYIAVGSQDRPLSRHHFLWRTRERDILYPGPPKSCLRRLPREIPRRHHDHMLQLISDKLVCFTGWTAAWDALQGSFQHNPPLCNPHHKDHPDPSARLLPPSYSSTNSREAWAIHPLPAKDRDITPGDADPNARGESVRAALKNAQPSLIHTAWCLHCHSNPEPPRDELTTRNSSFHVELDPHSGLSINYYWVCLHKNVGTR